MDNRQQQLIQGLMAAKDFRDMFSVIMQSGQDRDVFEYYEDDKLIKINYEEFFRKVKGSARKIREKIDPSESYLALKLPNGPEFSILFWAVLAAGHNIILLNYSDDLDTAIELMAQAGTETLISDKLKEDLAFLSASSLISEADEFDDNDWGDQVVLCTSGTTGDSRLFSHAGGSICQMARCLIKLSEDTDRWTRAEVVEKCIAFLPFHHVFGLMAVYIFTLLGGNTLVFIPSLAPEVVLDSCKKHRVTQVICIPLFWNALVKGLYRKIRQTEGESTLKAFEKLIESNLQAQAAGKKLPFFLANKLKSIRKQLLGEDIYLCVSGGGYIAPRTLEILNGLGYYFVNGYGLTEAGIISVCNDEDVTVRLNGNVGKPFEPEGTMISPEGEILLSGGCLHTGVLKGGEYLPKNYSADNWFETGDTGRIEDGAIFIDGRLKEVIISPSGENIYPDTVEALFQDLPGVQQLNVVGVKDGVNEYANLVLELVPDADPAELDQILKARLTKLPPSSAISNILVSLKPLPMSTTRKVKRQLLAKELNEGTWPAMKLSQYIEKRAAGFIPEIEAETSEDGSPKTPLSTDAGEINTAEAVEEDTKSKEEIKKIVKGFFAEALDLEEEEITDTGHFIIDLGGDSLSSLTLLNMLENEFDIKIVDDDYYSCMNLEDITDLIHKHLTGAVGEAGGEKIGPAKAKQVGERIDSVEKIREVKMFQKRAELLLAANDFHNPYFISQESPLRDISIMDDREMLNFGSYNYLSMSGDPEVNAASIEAINKYGTSASGSRLLAGEKDVHKKLEAAIARWKHTDDALALVSGHATNVTFIGNFCGQNDLIIYDRFSHNSVIQGVYLSRAQGKFFAHNDYEELEDFLSKNRDQYEKVLIVIEGAYSMDGDVAPVPEFVRISKKYGCFLLVDEAHSACVLGENGGGVDEHFNLAPDDIDIKMGTLSKGLGTCGGYLAGSQMLIDYLRYNLPGFTFSVGLSPALAGAALKVLEIMERDNSRVQSLHRNIKYFVERAQEMGFNTCLAKDTAVVPIMVGTDTAAFKLSIDMMEDGIIVPPAIFPAVPRGEARLRYCLTSSHKPEQIDYALNVLQKHLDKMNNEKANQEEADQ